MEEHPVFVDRGSLRNHKVCPLRLVGQLALCPLVPAGLLHLQSTSSPTPGFAGISESEETLLQNTAASTLCTFAWCLPTLYPAGHVHRL